MGSLDSPGIVFLAEWLWDSSPSPQVSAKICLSSFPVLTTPCLVALFSKLVGMGVIFGACLNKAPLVINILRSRSVAGMSAEAVYGEVLLYANSAFYSLLRNNPFTAWGENGVMTIQTLGVVILMWHYRSYTMTHKLVAIATFAAYVVFVMEFLPTHYYYMLMTINWPILMYSRGSQIYEFWKEKHTGTQSSITSGMNLLGSCIRLWTTIQEVGWDVTLLSGYALSALLNCVLLMQFTTYAENTRMHLKNNRLFSENDEETNNKKKKTTKME